MTVAPDHVTEPAGVRGGTRRGRGIDVPGSTGLWGMLLLIATEATLFASLLSSYFYVGLSFPTWPPEGIRDPELSLVAIGSVLLLSSSAPMAWAEGGSRRRRRLRPRLGVSAVMVLGLAFLGIQALEYSRAEFTPRTNVYGSLFFTITGLHGLHVVIGLLTLAWLQYYLWRDRLGEHGHSIVRIVALYWHFVDAVWVFVFVSLYLAPRLW